VGNSLAEPLRCSPPLILNAAGQTKDGQLTLPRELCEQLGLAPGQALEICSESGRLVAWKKAAGDPFEQWRGRGHLPMGKDADEYLRLIRDGDFGQQQLWSAPAERSGDLLLIRIFH
jgi:bifunctional DNA-binding transcriptional regulator/antitoxin component of YhaV-PrlF toxin-antitoxin module